MPVEDNKLPINGDIQGDDIVLLIREIAYT